MSVIVLGPPEDLASPLTVFLLYCMFKGPTRGCWRNYDNILRMKKVYKNGCTFAKVYSKTEAEWTLSNRKSFKMLLATFNSIADFQQRLNDIFAGREEVLIGGELQAAIYD
ncbi:hypothetical protein FRC08_001153 [Ceratobasidium sp. 394]|nr:hypothetical protein FRC08_001153 [Ceratobasidium sp. 394]